MPLETGNAFDPAKFFAERHPGQSVEQYRSKQTIFSQGDPADSVYYIQEGKITLVVISNQGKEGVLSILGPEDFFGEECLAGQDLRTLTAASISRCSLLRFEKDAMTRLLRNEPEFCQHFISYLLAKNTRTQEDLVDQLFYSSEKRLARVLLSLARPENGGKGERAIPWISQQVLADKVGTTRSRVGYCMNRFREQGLIDYNGELRINISLLSAFLRD